MGSGLNFLDLILEASLLVQLVMLGLVAMSVMSWAIIFQRKKAISDALSNAKKFEQKFWCTQHQNWMDIYTYAR